MKCQLLKDLNKRLGKRSILLAGALFLLGSSAFANTVTMQLIGPTGSAPNLAGVYTDPYLALVGPAGQTKPTIQGTPTPVICDDFETDVSLSTPPWQATVSRVSDLFNETKASTVVKFDRTATAAQQMYDYTVVAYLAVEIMGQNQNTSAGRTAAEELSFALWGVFDKTSAGPLSGSWVTGAQLTAAENYLTQAEKAVTTGHLTPANYANVIIYTPNPLTASQEYLFVSPIPETSAYGFLAMGLAGLLAFARRARKPVVAVD